MLCFILSEVGDVFQGGVCGFKAPRLARAFSEHPPQHSGCSEVLGVTAGGLPSGWGQSAAPHPHRSGLTSPVVCSFLPNIGSLRSEGSPHAPQLLSPGVGFLRV